MVQLTSNSFFLCQQFYLYSPHFVFATSIYILNGLLSLLSSIFPSESLILLVPWSHFSISTLQIFLVLICGVLNSDRALSVLPHFQYLLWSRILVIKALILSFHLCNSLFPGLFSPSPAIHQWFNPNFSQIHCLSQIPAWICCIVYLLSSFLGALI